MSFKETSIEQISAFHKRVTETQASNKLYPLEYRKVQLRKLYWAIKDNEAEVYDALKKDLGKPHNEAYMSEVGWMYKDILYALNNLDKWAAPESQSDMETIFKFLLSPRIRKEPIGTVLIIGCVQSKLFPL